MSGEAPRLDGRLRIEWLAFLGATAIGATVGSRLVTEVAGSAAGWRWLLGFGGLLAAEVGFVRYHLDAPWLDRGRLRKTIGLPTALTLIRGVLYAAAAGFLFVAPSSAALRWAPGACYGVGATLDFVDGRLARRNGQTTDLGERLDHAFDTLGFLVAPLVGVAWGRLPIWYLSLSAARYVFLAGLTWRRWAGRPVYPLPPSRLRRRLAAFQMAFITVALLPVLPAAIIHPAAGAALAPSLAWFLRDWLVVSGRLPRREE